MSATWLVVVITQVNQWQNPRKCVPAQTWWIGGVASPSQFGAHCCPDLADLGAAVATVEGDVVRRLLGGEARGQLAFQRRATTTARQPDWRPTRSCGHHPAGTSPVHRRSRSVRATARAGVEHEAGHSAISAAACSTTSAGSQPASGLTVGPVVESGRKSTVWKILGRVDHVIFPWGELLPLLRMRRDDRPRDPPRLHTTEYTQSTESKPSRDCVDSVYSVVTPS